MVSHIKANGEVTVFRGMFIYELGVYLKGVSFEFLIFLKGYFVRLELVYNKNVAIVNIIYGIVNKKAFSAAKAK